MRFGARVDLGDDGAHMSDRHHDRHVPPTIAQTDPDAFAAMLTKLQRFDFAPNRGTVFSAHQMGTARMGSNPNDHVCDPWGRVRSTSRPAATDPRKGIVKGLYVADTSLFPTAIGVNPMVTVLALAKRVARTILAD